MGSIVPILEVSTVIQKHPTVYKSVGTVGQLNTFPLSCFMFVALQNKKQRQVVREAVLRMKDPQQLLMEIEEIEKMEGELGTAPLPNEKGLQEKKRKLHSHLNRVVMYYVSLS